MKLGANVTCIARMRTRKEVQLGLYVMLLADSSNAVWSALIY